MAVKLDFYISDDNMDRLWAIKEKDGKVELTGNQYAKMLLERTLKQLHPERVETKD